MLSSRLKCHVCEPEACEGVQVSQWNIADDVVEDYDAGLEYGEAESILKSVQKGDAREYLVRSVSDSLVQAFPHNSICQILLGHHSCIPIKQCGQSDVQAYSGK